MCAQPPYIFAVTRRAGHISRPVPYSGSATISKGVDLCPELDALPDALHAGLHAVLVGIIAQRLAGLRAGLRAGHPAQPTAMPPAERDAGRLDAGNLFQ